MLFRTAPSLVKQHGGGGGGRNTQLDRQPHNVHMYVTLLPLFQLGQELAGELEEWKGKVNNTDSA